MKAGVRAHVKRSVVLSICIILLGLSFFSSVVKAGESKKSNVIEKNAKADGTEKYGTEKADGTEKDGTVKGGTEKADGTEKDSETVRVGWYETPFNQTDRFGRRSGYGYEYQQKIAAYAGWNYEYVKGSWSECYQMLLDGEIDLMSDISYTEERAEKMLFTTLPMGEEAYYRTPGSNLKLSPLIQWRNRCRP